MDFDALDDVIHQKVRLGAMSLLVAAAAEGGDGVAGGKTTEVDFATLKARLGVTDGNLSTHLSVLEQHGYVGVRKTTAGRRKPRTTYALTPLGRQAWRQYVETLDALLHPPPPQQPPPPPVDPKD